MFRSFILLLSLCFLVSCSSEEKKRTTETDIDEPENNPIVFSTGVQAEETGGCHSEFGYVPEGATIMAYAQPEVMLPSSCKAEARVCKGGALSGTASYLSCLEKPAQ